MQLKKRKSRVTKKRSSKPRSAKQLANDKRLGRMAKKRHAMKKSRVTKKSKKIVRKKVATRGTRRKVNPINTQYLVFQRRKNSLKYFSINNNGEFSFNKYLKNAVFLNKRTANIIANRYANLRSSQSLNIQHGIATQGTTSAQIKRKSNPK